MVRLIIKDRGKGKTTQLLYTSATTGYPILVSSNSQVNYLLQKAKELELVIPQPITRNYLKGRQIDNILIDEGYDLIGEALENYIGCKVIAVTLTDKIKERWGKY